MRRKGLRRSATQQLTLERRKTRIYLCEVCLKTFDTGPELRKHKITHLTGPVEMLHDRKIKNTLHPFPDQTTGLEDLESFRLLRKLLQNGLKSNLMTLLGNKSMPLQSNDIETDCPVIENVNEIGSNRKEGYSKKKKVGFTCGQCGKWFASKVSLKIHLNSHTGFKPYTCPKCGLRLSQKGGLTVHMRIHTGEKPFKCTICNRAFTQGVSRNHMAVHLGEKPYKCDICPAVFGSGTVLKTHKISKHTLLRPFQCDICKKDFADVHYMRKHKAVHRAVRPYPCSKCDKSFITKSNLTRHLITHTGERPYVCTICQKSYTNGGSLIYHLTTHSEEKNFICGICGQELSTKQNLKSHVKRHRQLNSIKQ